MKRDEYSIIIQEGDVENESGGDSAFSTGMMCFGSSPLDFIVCPRFIVKDDKGKYRVVRHPYQERWNKPELTSRDQVVAYFGCARFSLKEEQRAAALTYAQEGRVNADILLPHVREYLYRAAGVDAPTWIKLTAKVTLKLSILWDAYVKPDHEMNQSVLICAAAGKEYLAELKRRHPDLIGNIRAYYSGWRNKKEMGELIIKKIEELT